MSSISNKSGRKPNFTKGKTTAKDTCVSVLFRYATKIRRRRERAYIPFISHRLPSPIPAAHLAPDACSHLYEENGLLREGVPNSMAATQN
ncbi:hypothetical protein SK128_007470 [Halocaridina rubra]|uniref:Uncharacterized protein n=1 Tax=Halocaridina rubra TaxID=373956 RepID=A0AAN8XI11_HALRR